MTIKARFTTTILGAVACMGLTSCAVPQAGGPGGPQYQPQPAPVAAPQGPTRYDPTGHWCFRDGNNRNVKNIIELREGGILVSPAGRKGASAFYREAGPNLYQHANGATYEFYNEEQGVWRRGKNVWPHRRCG